MDKDEVTISWQNRPPPSDLGKTDSRGYRRGLKYLD